MAWKRFRWARWTLAFLIVAGALSVSAYWVASGTRPVCTVATVTHMRAARSGSTGSETTQTCGLPNVSDYIYVLAVVGVLLLPDARSLKIGGFEFQRLTTEVESTRREIGDLRQTVTSTVSNSLQVLVGTVRTAADDLRATFRAQRSALDRVRYALPDDSQTTGQLEIIDGIARQINSDDLDLEELIRAIGIMRSLVAQGQLIESGTQGDTVEGAAQAENVVRGILDQPGAF